MTAKQGLFSFLNLPTKLELVNFYSDYQDNPELVERARNETVGFKFKNLSIIIDKNNLFSEGNKVLDIGCGYGTLLECLHARYNIDSYGIEYSEKKVSMAQKKFPNFTFKTGDAESIAFPDNFFDYVIFTDVIEHLISPEQLISEARRVSKKGIIFICPYERNLEFYFHCFKHLLRQILKGKRLTILEAFGGHIQFWNHYTFLSFLSNNKQTLSNYYLPSNPLDAEYTLFEWPPLSKDKPLMNKFMYYVFLYYRRAIFLLTFKCKEVSSLFYCQSLVGFINSKKEGVPND